MCSEKYFPCARALKGRNRKCLLHKICIELHSEYSTSISTDERVENISLRFFPQRRGTLLEYNTRCIIFSLLTFFLQQEHNEASH